jgi:hypothetical protein
LKDIVVNLSPEFQTRFTKVHVPNVNWAVKWVHPITNETRFMDIVFDDGTLDDGTLVEYFNDDEIEDDVDSEAEVFGYDDEDEDDEDDVDGDGDGDGGDGDDDGDDDNVIFKKSGFKKSETNDVGLEYFPDFDFLEPEESLLPLTYVVSPFEQWSSILDACKSDFKIVKNLDKVNNKTLKLIADAAAISNNIPTARSLHFLKVNNAFIRYAKQRNV